MISPAPRPNLGEVGGRGRPHPQPRGRGAGRDRRQVHPARGRLQVDRRGADPRRHRQPGEGAGRVDRRRAASSTTTRSRRCSRATTRSWCPAASASAAPRARSAPPRFARERKVPYLGICLGMQMAVIEASRNLLGPGRRRLRGVRPRGGRAALHPRHLPPQGVARGQPHDQARGHRRQGRHHAARRLRRDPQRAAARRRRSTARTTISERHRHRYEVDIAYRDKLEGCGLRFSGLSPDGRLPEIVEIPGHPGSSACSSTRS